MTTTALHDRPAAIWFDGQLVQGPEAKIHVMSHGLHYASSVFEGVRAYGGRIFKLREHSARLLASAKMLGFEIPYSVEEIDRACTDTLAAAGLEEAYVRPIAWLGSEDLKVSSHDNRVHLAVGVWPWGSYFAPEERMRGIRLNLAPYKRPSPETAPTAAKAAGLYMICTLSKNQAENAGYQDALMLDWRGYIAEATGANIFLIRDGEIHTPTPDCFLNGITRQTVIALAKDQGLTVHERHIPFDELGAFSEVFLTGSAAEVTPVREIDCGDQGVYAFTPGKITQTLLSAYTDAVRAPVEA